MNVVDTSARILAQAQRVAAIRWACECTGLDHVCGSKVGDDKRISVVCPKSWSIREAEGRCRGRTLNILDRGRAPPVLPASVPTVSKGTGGLMPGSTYPFFND